MAKKKKTAADEHRTTADYYKLNVKAVEDLVGANAENSPKVSEAELRKYRSGPKIKLADWVKAVLIKFWFAGAVCFFFLWGLGTYIHDQLDQMVILGLALGFVTDLLTNNLYRFYAKPAGANDRWMMISRKGVPGLLLNLVYAFILLGLVVMSYNIINRIAAGFTGAEDAVPVGVEPILFGFLTMGWDMLLLGAKRLFGRMVEDAKKQAR